ncbi:ATP-binding cassette sub-family C member 10-like isoform X2 [Hydractinia symbiolongicarpus]|uniref:ATP-binding cassette sub-family C member 10-like isoform X2 n=1 Tax=Hydractinia symbiolongicarpus TaxID=13093 RepID=UPI00254FECA5|nr:ATP-binding cassette sub-family C member 10-like isoform X2 [Hydractinia symbiolongicarpus]
MESIQRFCGLPSNGSYHIWNQETKTFGQCFLWTAVGYTSHAVFAVVCAYLLGNLKRSKTKQKYCLLWIINIITFLLALTSMTELIISYSLKHKHPPAYVLSKTLSFSTWLLCILVQTKRATIDKQKKEGNKYILLVFLLILLSSTLQLHFVIKHVLDENLQLKNISADYIGAIVYFALNCCFFICSAKVNFTKTKRTTFNRAIPSLNRNASIQAFDAETSGEHTESSSLLSSSQSQGSYYEAYRKHKTARTNIYLGKAENSKGIFSWLSFWWVNDLILKGYHNQLHNPDDLFILPSKLDTNTIKEIFSSMLRIQRHQSMLRELNTDTIDDYQEPRYKRRKNVKISMLKSLHNAFGRFYYSLGILKFLVDCLGFAAPILLNRLVLFVENKNEKMSNGYYYALGLFLSNAIQVLIYVQYVYNINKVRLQARAGLITTIYEKTLSVSTSSLGEFSTGQIVNFMSTDTDRITNFYNSFHEFWSLPFQVAGCLYLLYQQVGLAFLSGLGFTILLIPINRWLAIKIGDLSKKMMTQKDNRVKIISEILFGIRVIKLYAWENHFKEKVEEARKWELKSLKGRKYLDALCVYFWATTPVLISLLTFATYVYMGNELTAAKVFTSISLFNMLIAPLNAFPWVLNGLMEAWVSLKRVEKYLCLREINLDEYYVKVTPDDSDNAVFEMDKAVFCWKETDLLEISPIQLPQGDFDNEEELYGVKKDENVVVGEHTYNIVKPFSLRNITMLVEKGQFVGISGKVGCGKSSLFAAITAEMEKESGHIYLGDEFQGFAYVTQEPWIQHMTFRDNILFGHSFDPEFYNAVLHACALMEDLELLPAGDLTEIGENGVTLSGGQKARVALARAVYQDKDIYLLDDPIAAVDSDVAAHIFNHCIMGLLKNKTRFLCTHHTKYLWRADTVIVLDNGEITAHGPPEQTLTQEELIEDVDSPKYVATSQNHSKMPKETLTDITLDSSSSKEIAAKGKLVEEEKKEEGYISLNVYKSYWKAVGNSLAASVIMFLLLMQASRNVSDWWLAYWISHVKANDNTTVYSDYRQELSQTHVSHDVKHYLYIYAGIGAANSVFTFLRAFFFAYGGIQAARHLHKKLLHAILHAPIFFFDVTPIGRILNRFSSDTYAVDDSLPFMMNIMFAQVFGVFGTIIVTCYGIPWFTAVLVPIGAIYYYTQHHYRKTSRELKRLCSITLSPIYEHFSETLSGLMTIRAFRESHRFIAENERKLDFNQRANYSRLVGLAISYALAIRPRLSGLVNAFAETEKELIGVERVAEYVEETPTEEDGSYHVDNFWPQQGILCFRNVCLQYRRGLPFALDDVSFYVKPGEKIGVCGRTGSGKSSLFRLLFKTVKLNHGEIIVDGVNIENAHISQIRSQMSIIPQDAFLFDDTVAMNLDPKQEHTSFEMMDVIEKCHLKKTVQDLGGLNGNVGERGLNLSAGQKQLLCLARALLKKSKIICVDEATASVDFETDKLIQQTIRKEFASSTVLTIAHRIDTIMDSDRVLVMNAGRVAEFSPPRELLADRDSLFYLLAHENHTST